MLEAYLAELLEDIQTEFEKVRASYDVDAIHDMRVNIKRLRAVCGFLKHFDPSFDAKQNLKPFRAVFKRIGVIRDVQVPLLLISQLNEEFALNESKLVRKLQSDEKQEVKLTAQWFKNEVISFENEKVKLLEVAGSFSFSEAETRQYLNNLLADLRPIKLKYHTRFWHRKRVKLKAYHHVLDALYAMGAFPPDENELKLIKIVEALIGDWHDRVVTLGHLKEWEVRGRLESLVRQQAAALKSASRIYLSELTRSR